MRRTKRGVGIMSKIFGRMSREDRKRDVTLGSEESIRVEINVGSAANTKKIAAIEVYESETGLFMLEVNGRALKGVRVENATKRKV